MPSAAPTTIAALIAPVLLSTCSKKVCSAGSTAGVCLARSAFTTVNRMALCSVLREPGTSGPSPEFGQISSVESAIAAYRPRGYQDDWDSFILKQKALVIRPLGQRFAKQLNPFRLGWPKNCPSREPQNATRDRWTQTTRSQQKHRGSVGYRSVRR